MQITVPDSIGANPLEIIIGGVSYFLGAGETITVPDAVATELYRKIAAQVKPYAPVDLPFTDASINKLNSDIGALDTRVADVEAAVQVKELPDFPESAGTFQPGPYHTARAFGFLSHPVHLPPPEQTGRPL